MSASGPSGPLVLSYLLSSEKGTDLNLNFEPAERGFGRSLLHNPNLPNQGSALSFLRTPNLPGFVVRKPMSDFGEWNGSFSEPAEPGLYPVLSPNYGVVTMVFFFFFLQMHVNNIS